MEIVEEAPGGHEDTVASGDLIVRRGIAYLDDLLIADGQHDAATVRWGRATQRDAAQVGAVGDAARGKKGVEDRLAAGERVGARRVHLAEDVNHLALPRNDAHEDWPGVASLYLDETAGLRLDLLDCFARDDQPAILAEVNGTVGQHWLVAGQADG